MKVKLYQLDDIKVEYNYDRLRENFDSPDQKNALLESIDKDSDSAKNLLNVKTSFNFDIKTQLDKFYIKCLSKRKNWNENLPEGSEYFGNDNGEERIKKGDFLITENNDVYVFSTFSLEKLNKDESKELIRSLNVENKKGIELKEENPYCTKREKEVADWISSSTKIFLPSIHATTQEIVMNELKQKKPNLSESDNKFLSIVIAKKLLQNGDSNISSNQLELKDFRKDFDIEISKLEQSRKPKFSTNIKPL